MINRRRLLLALVASTCVVAFSALAQQEARVRRIGYFALAAPVNEVWLGAFRKGMAALGWTEKRDYVLDARFADGGDAALVALASQFSAAPPDVMLLGGEPSVQPFLKTSQGVPVVVALATDPVGMGYADSLRRPGRNVTGLTMLSRDLTAKRLELLQQAFPRINNVALVYSKGNPGGIAQLKEAEQAAKRLKLRILPLGLAQGTDIVPAYKQGAALGAHAFLITQMALVTTASALVVETALHAKVPTMFYSSLLADRGGLISYAPSSVDNFSRAAAYVDKILKGAKAGELPIEQPNEIELVINMKTARAMRITFPQSIMLRANRVIE